MKKYIVIALIVIVIIYFKDKVKANSKTEAKEINLSQATIDKINQYSDHIYTVSQSTGIQEKRIKAHIAVESAGDANATGSVGEVGLMQLTQGALTDVNENYYLQLSMQDITDPYKNIWAGVYYLRLLFIRAGHDIDKGSMAYNVGIRGLTTNKQAGENYLAKIKKAETYF